MHKQLLQNNELSMIKHRKTQESEHPKISRGAAKFSTARFGEEFLGPLEATPNQLHAI